LRTIVQHFELLIIYQLDYMKTLITLALTLVVVLTLGACGGGNTSETTAEAEPSVPTDGREITIRPVANEMKYDTDSLMVSAGSEVTLIFENIATLPTMIHNIVVLTTNEDEDANRVGMAALTAPEFLPEDDAIFVATPMAQPGETVRVSFTAPTTPGTHRYICTYPGHYALMQGVLIVS